MTQANQLRQRPSRGDVWRAAGVPLVATAIVFWQGSIRVGVIVQTLHDKVTHFVAFGGLAILCVPCVRAIALRKRWSRLAQVLLCAGYATVVGGLLELWQALLPYRSAEWLDFVADAAGGCAASAVVLFIFSRLERKT